MKLIDVRYNLEYVGFQKGMNNYTDEDKLEQLSEMNKEEIMKDISECGCPYRVNFMLKKPKKECQSSCINCWEREV